MKWKCFPIPATDSAARNHIFRSIETGAQAHTLGKKLLAQFTEADGPMSLIAFESIDLDYPYLYEYATYRGGQPDPVGTEPFSWTDAPIWGLVEFLDTWLRTSLDAVVFCENRLATREEATRGVADGASESRIVCFGANEVYHVLTNEDRGNGAAIEATLRESQYYWTTNVCSRCADLPRGDIPSEAFFDDIAGSTRHIFVPTLDEEGFLIWSPRISQANLSG
jgi:hypothetical protein